MEEAEQKRSRQGVSHYLVTFLASLAFFFWWGGGFYRVEISFSLALFFLFRFGISLFVLRINSFNGYAKPAAAACSSNVSDSNAVVAAVYTKYQSHVSTEEEEEKREKKKEKSRPTRDVGLSSVWFCGWGPILS